MSAGTFFCTKKVLARVALFFIIFPFISFSLNDLDLQPTPFVLALIFFIFNNRLPNKLMAVGVFAVFCAFIALISGSSLKPILRAIVTGFSPFIFAAYAYGALGGEINFKRYLFSGIIVYFCCAIIQIVVGLNSFDWFVVARSTSDRGVSSLTPEPSMFGLYSILIYAAYLMLDDGKSWLKYLAYCLVGIQVLFFSQSSLAIVILLLASCLATYYFNSKVVFYSLIFLLILFFSIVGVFASLISDHRVLNIARIIGDLDLYLLLWDSSIRDRYCHLALPLQSFFRDFGFPHGISNFDNEVSNVKLGSICSEIHSTSNSKIMSGFGQLIYENGIFSLILISSMWNIMYRSSLVNYKKAFVCSSLFLTQLSSGTIALPIFGLIIGIFLFKADSSTKCNVD